MNILISLVNISKNKLIFKCLISRTQPFAQMLANSFRTDRYSLLLEVVGYSVFVEGEGTYCQNLGSTEANSWVLVRLVW